MTTQRYYYADSISDFLSRSNNDILAEMTKYSQFSVDPQTRDSWIEEFDSLREVLTEYKDRGSLYLEYNIPRMGTRADVVLLKVPQGQVTDMLQNHGGGSLIHSNDAQSEMM